MGSLLLAIESLFASATLMPAAGFETVSSSLQCSKEQKNSVLRFALLPRDLAVHLARPRYHSKVRSLIWLVDNTGSRD